MSGQSSALLKMIVSMAIFGSIGFFTQLSGLPSIELVFVRCVSATLFIGAVWLVKGVHKNEQWHKKEVLRVLLCGVFLVYNWVFLFKAFEHTSITVAISLYNLAPIFVLLIGAVVFKEKIKSYTAIAIFICFIGTVCIADIDFTQPFQQLFPVGVLWALSAALFYAFLAIVGKGIQQLSPYATTFLQTGLGILLLLPFVDFQQFIGLTATNWLYIGITGIVHTGIVYLLYFDSLRYLPTALISLIAFVDPAVAILLDVVITGFIPTSLQIVGIVCIFAGMAFTLVRKRGV